MPDARGCSGRTMGRIARLGVVETAVCHCQVRITSPRPIRFDLRRTRAYGIEMTDARCLGQSMGPCTSTSAAACCCSCEYPSVVSPCFVIRRSPRRMSEFRGGGQAGHPGVCDATLWKRREVALRSVGTWEEREKRIDVTFSRTMITKLFLTGPWKAALGEARRGTHSSGRLWRRPKRRLGSRASIGPDSSSRSQLLPNPR